MSKYRDAVYAAIEKQEAIGGRELTGHEVQRLEVDVFVEFLGVGRVDDLIAALHQGEHPYDMVNLVHLIQWVTWNLEKSGRADAVDRLYRPLPCELPILPAARRLPRRTDSYPPGSAPVLQSLLFSPDLLNEGVRHPVHAVSPAHDEIGGE